MSQQACENSLVADSSPLMEQEPYPSKGLNPVQRVMLWNAVTMACGKQTGWIQLAGHEGNFLLNPARRTILKRHCAAEHRALEALMQDKLRPYVPAFHGVVTLDNGHKYIEMEDLLAGFCLPAIMDCKVGIRTYLEDELKSAKPRQDMYAKMVAVDASEPTPAEHEQRAVTKVRYMQWRERASSTSRYGFRIDAMHKDCNPAKIDFKKTADRAAIVSQLCQFCDHSHAVLSRYRDRLLSMRLAMEASPFVAQHEIIGSSLLFVHDATHSGIWLIDFAKTLDVKDLGATLTHRQPWSPGNHEDGYLTGVDNLVDMLAEAAALSDKHH